MQQTKGKGRTTWRSDVAAARRRPGAARRARRHDEAPGACRALHGPERWPTGAGEHHLVAARPRAPGARRQAAPRRCRAHAPVWAFTTPACAFWAGARRRRAARFPPARHDQPRAIRARDAAQRWRRARVRGRARARGAAAGARRSARTAHLLQKERAHPELRRLVRRAVTLVAVAGAQVPALGLAAARALVPAARAGPAAASPSARAATAVRRWRGGRARQRVELSRNRRRLGARVSAVMRADRALASRRRGHPIG